MVVSWEKSVHAGEQIVTRGEGKPSRSSKGEVGWRGWNREGINRQGGEGEVRKEAGYWEEVSRERRTQEEERKGTEKEMTTFFFK